MEQFSYLSRRGSSSLSKLGFAAWLVWQDLKIVQKERNVQRKESSFV
jgi:hypothetical protein